ncbi:MAG: hypothetical protein IPF68_16455 [Bacteroidales bacterium]|nr:hypothetical protein [Bacteroidales bacterium]
MSSAASWTAVDLGLPPAREVFAFNLAGELYTTLDGGSVWDFTNDSIGDTYVTELAVNGSVAFAGTFSSGVFISENYGQTWTRRNQGFQTCILQLAAGDNMVYAGTMDGRVFQPVTTGIPGLN